MLIEQESCVTLKCGHSVCTGCIKKLKNDGTGLCPSCVLPLNALVGTHLRTGYSMPPTLTAINITTAASPSQSDAVGLDTEMKSKIQVQKDSMANADRQHQETETQLAVYEDQLTNWLRNHQQLTTKLNFLVDKNSAVMDLLNKEKQKIKDQKEISQACKTDRQQIKYLLDSVSLTSKASTVISQAQANHSATDNWISNCQQHFPDMNAVRQSQQVPDSMFCISFMKM